MESGVMNEAREGTLELIRQKRMELEEALNNTQLNGSDKQALLRRINGEITDLQTELRRLEK